MNTAEFAGVEGWGGVNVGAASSEVAGSLLRGSSPIAIIRREMLFHIYLKF